ncbi:MAG: hypothetical protein LBV80_11610 [Deltaproteobacteria bacterium]|jgi:hypothetical protein|nr:hypothetical protein [Deltaproteobacteria bacterium]
MNKDKRWTYKQITEKTYESITMFMEMADQAGEAPQAIVFRHFAYGAYDLWKKLTQGCWHKSEDKERMETLIGTPWF